MYKSYWLDSNDWPRETRTHLPLAKAVLDIGAALITGWTGNEPCDAAGLTNGIRPFVDARRDDRCRAHDHLTKESPGYIACPNFQKMPSNWTAAEFRPTPALPDYCFSRSGYEQAIEIIRAKNEPLVPGALRLGEAKREFIRAATMGEFGTAVRETKSFRAQPLNPDIWSVVRAGNVFTCCVLNPSEPHSIAVAGDKYLPVMVESASFRAWLARVRAAQSPASTVRTGRSINDPIGPMNSDVRRAISTATQVWTTYKLETEDAVFEAIKLSENPISRRAFDDHVIAAARIAANAPAKRGRRPGTKPANGEA